MKHTSEEHEAGLMAMDDAFALANANAKKRIRELETSYDQVQSLYEEWQAEAGKEKARADALEADLDRLLRAHAAQKARADRRERDVRTLSREVEGLREELIGAEEDAMTQAEGHDEARREVERLRAEIAALVDVNGGMTDICRNRETEIRSLSDHLEFMVTEDERLRDALTEVLAHIDLSANEFKRGIHEAVEHARTALTPKEGQADG